MSILQSSVPFPKTKLKRFLLALCISAVTPAIYIYGLAVVNTFAGNVGTFCNEAGVGTCSPFHEASMSFGLYYILFVPITLGASVFIPALILWVIFEFANSVSQKKF